MLTTNAQTHESMNRFHQPTDGKRKVVILPEASYTDWLAVPLQRSMEFMHQYPADRSVASAAPIDLRQRPADDAQRALL